MPDLHLPKPTTANERLWPIQLEPKYQVFVNSLLEKNWWKHHGADWFQPLFGLTAKDTTGKVRTVVEGDVWLVNGEPFIVVWDKDIWSFVTRAWREDGFAMAPVFRPYAERQDRTILCHATDIVAAGNKLTCWECHGSGRVVSCPTCHGEGTFNIVWKE